MYRKPFSFLVAAVFLTHLALGACECEESRVSATLAELAAVPNPVDFGEVPVSTMKSIDVSLINRGTGTVHLHDLDILENQADFSLSLPGELTFPHAIPPGNQVVFAVRYHPQEYPAEDQSFVRIQSTDRDAPQYDLPCLGTAVEPILLVQPVPVDFGSTRVLSTSPATLVITHTGSKPGPVTITTLSLTNSGGGDFSVQDAAGTPLVVNPDEETRVHLAYTPQAIDDADEGEFLIESDAEAQEHMPVPLLGSSHAPHIVVLTRALDFGTVSQGANPTLPFTIESAGNDPLTIKEMKLTETGSQKFSLSPAVISDPIAPGAEVEVRVSYIADDRGDDTGTLMITHDDPLERPIFIQLHGRTPAPDIDVLPDFFSIKIAKESHTQTADIRIYNVGDEDLKVFGCQFDNPDGTFSIESQPSYTATVPPGTVEAGPFETVVVRFTVPAGSPSVISACTLTFSTDDPDEQTVVVTVEGNYSP